MDISPILQALWRRKTGAVLIALQISLTLAIVSNSLFIIVSKLEAIGRPTGIDEENIFTLFNQWIEQSGDMKARLQSDLSALRSLPDLVDAYASGSFPLAGAGSTVSVQLSPEQVQQTSVATLYAADTHTMSTLGIRLFAGRWFQQEEIRDSTEPPTNESTAVVVTKALADQLFERGAALGKTIYLEGARSCVIVGIIDRTQGLQPSGPYVDNAIFEPQLWVSQGSFYIVRTRPGRLMPAIKAATTKLMQLDRGRVFGYVATFQESRSNAYHGDRSIAIVLASVSVLLLLATAFGIAGLSSHWVTQRRRQIGVRRALGARRLEIVRYFLVENLFISTAGTVLGAVAAILTSVWLTSRFAIAHIEAPFVAFGALALICLGQISAILPALRAAAIPPALAARGS